MSEVLTPQGESLGIITPMWRVNDLTLAEIALLRRLNVRPAFTARRTQCEGILAAAGVGQPPISLVRLEGRHLISAPTGEERSLTSEGNVVVRDFNDCLIHDPFLVLAYRKVTLAINSTIRLDGQPPVPSSVSFSDFLQSFLGSSET